MNPRFDTTMRTAFIAGANKTLSAPAAIPVEKQALLETVVTSIDRGVGAPRPRRDR